MAISNPTSPFKEEENLTEIADNALEWNDSVVVPTMPFRARQWEIPDFDYLEYLNFGTHVNTIQPYLRGVYTQRHLWNHMCIFRQVMPSTPQFPHFETALNVLARHFRVGVVQDLPIDQRCLNNFHLVMDQVLDLWMLDPFPTTRYWNNQAEFPSLMEIYNHEVQLWASRISTNTNMYCILSLIARNYFVIIMTYLMFLETFDNVGLRREAEAIYNLLTDYTRCFEQCGTFNLYANVLAHVDGLFCRLHH
jgi:hypothetical protein